MKTCAVEGCEDEATEKLRVTATLGGGRNIYMGPPVTLDEVEMDVPVCAAHREYLIQDAFRGVSMEAAGA